MVRSMLKQGWLRQMALGAILSFAVGGQRPVLGQEAGTEPGAAANPKIDLSYLPPNTVCALAVFPRQTLKKPDADYLPLEVFSLASRRDLGIDLMDVEQAVVGWVHDGKRADGEPTPFVLVRATQPIDRAPLIKAMSVPSEPQQTPGGALFVSQIGDKWVALFPDERTLVLSSTEPRLQDPAGQKGELFDRLRAERSGDDFVLVFALDPVRSLIDAQLAKQPPPPPPFSMLLDARKHLSLVELRGSILRPGRLQLTLLAKNNSGATNLEGALNMVMAMGRMAVAAQIQKAPPTTPDDPEVDAAFMRYGQRMVDRIFAALKPTRNGREVEVKIEGDAGVATTGITVALLLPAVQAAREAARRVQSTNNLKQLAVAMITYQDAHKTFPQRASVDKQGRPLLSWRVHLLPYLDQMPLYKQFHLDEPWDSEHNKKLIPRMPATLATPNRPNDGKTVYLVPVGQGTMFGGDKGMGIAEITDGLSNTIMIVEADADRAVEWTRPDDLAYDPERPLAGLGHVRLNVFLAAFADGSVRTLAIGIDPEVLRALFTAAGSETVDPQ